MVCAMDKNVIEVKIKSVVPVYGVGVVWVLYCLIFPLYSTWHFVVLACSGALAFVLLSLIFPGKVRQIEVPMEPERTGDELIDALLNEGETAVAEMRRLRVSLKGQGVCDKLDGIISVTDKIFKFLLDSPDGYRQVKRFADFFLPTTIKLLHAYDRFGQSGAQGENISASMERIDTALDSILVSYNKFFDSLFENKALDIETDISVLEGMLKREGLLANGELKIEN